MPASPLLVKYLIDLKKEADANQRVIDYCTVLRLIASNKETIYSQISPINIDNIDLNEVSQDTKSLVDQIRNPQTLQKIKDKLLKDKDDHATFYLNRGLQTYREMDRHSG